MTTGKTIALTRQTFVVKVMSLFSNMLSRLVKTFLPRNKHLLHASKVMLKILQARLQQYMNVELPDVQAGFRKGRDVTLPTKVCLVKAMVFPVVIFGCELDYKES